MQKIRYTPLKKVYQACERHRPPPGGHSCEPRVCSGPPPRPPRDPASRPPPPPERLVPGGPHGGSHQGAADVWRTHWPSGARGLRVYGPCPSPVRTPALTPICALFPLATFGRVYTLQVFWLSRKCPLLAEFNYQPEGSSQEALSTKHQVKPQELDLTSSTARSSW